MVSHHSARFGGHRHCGSGYIFVAIEGQDFTYSLRSAITVCLKITWHAMLSHTKFQNIVTIICRCVQ